MIHSVIMAGGKGERFWPKSREKTPKQLLAVTGEKTMIEETVDRISLFTEMDDIFIVTNEVQAEGVRQVLPGLPDDNVITEPCGRNTAACIALAAAYIEDDESVMVVLPADHVIHDMKSFSILIKDISILAQKEDALFTIGIKPTYPATGYGYINTGAEYITDLSAKVSIVNGFKEKPDFDRAKKFFDSGEYLWNSGIFIWRKKVFIECVKKYMPELYKGYLKIAENIKKPNLKEIINEVYPALPNISVDYGIMEKAEHVIVAESTFDWDDVGSWDAIANHFTPDSNGNIAKNKFISVDTTNCIIDSDKLVAAVGVDNLIVVQTDDALLICPKSRAQDVKKIVQQLQSEPEYKDYL